jgi:hypothetical protein
VEGVKIEKEQLGTTYKLAWLGRNARFAAIRLVPALMLLVLISACDDSSQRAKEQVVRQEREAEKASLLDATLVEHAIERRLRKQISAGDGLIIVRDPDLSAVHTMPSATQWKITCDWSGIVITFVFGGGDDSNSVVVPITDVSLSQEQCANLGPIVGRKLLELSSKPNQG